MSNKRNRNQRRKDVRKAQVLDPSVRGDAPNSGGSSFASLGAPGTAIYGGYVLNKEKDSRLVGQERYVTYSDMLANVSIVGAGVRYFVDLVAKANWEVQPADDSSEAEKIAETVEDMMNGMATPWHKVVKRACMYTFWGFSIQEWTAKRRDDGQVGYLDIEPRAQMTIERWDTDVSGTVLGVVQRNPQNQEEIYLPISKCIYLVDNTLNDSPEGMGLFRNIIKAAEKLQRYELLEAWGFDTDLRGIPIVRGPFTQLEQMVNNQQLTTAQANALKQPMIDFLESHNKNPELGMMLDSMTYQTTDERATPSPVKQWDVELLKGDPNGQEEVHVAIQRINREIGRVLGVEQLLLGENGGSNALARDKTAQFGLIVDSCLKELKETFEKDFLDPLWLLNGWDPALKPTFKIEKIQYRDIEEVVSALEKLSRAGYVMDANDPAGNEIRSLVGLSERPEQEEVDLTLGMDALKDPLAPEKEEEVPDEEEETPDE